MSVYAIVISVKNKFRLSSSFICNHIFKTRETRNPGLLTRARNPGQSYLDVPVFDFGSDFYLILLSIAQASGI